MGSVELTIFNLETFKFISPSTVMSPFKAAAIIRNFKFLTEKEILDFEFGLELSV